MPRLGWAPSYIAIHFDNALPTPGYGSQQLITFAPDGSVTNHGAQFVIEAGEPLFQSTDMLIDAAI